MLGMLGIIVAAGFAITRSVPGDPVLKRVSGFGGNDLFRGDAEDEQHYREVYYREGYHLPVFYFSTGNLAVPDSFNHLPSKKFRNAVIRLSMQTGHPHKVYKLLHRTLQSLKSRNLNHNSVLNADINSIADVREIKSAVELHAEWKQLQSEISGWKKWIPVIRFHSHNQFAGWFAGDQFHKGILQGSLGYSDYSHRNVTSELKKPFTLTLLMTILSLFISVIISFITAVWIVNHRRSKISSWLSSLLVFVYALPVFWVGSMLLLVFSGNSSLGFIGTTWPLGLTTDAMNVFSLMRTYWPYLVLPVVCYSYGAVAFITRLLQSSLTAELEKEYALTLAAKGLPETVILRKHALRNAVMPVVTVVLGVLPPMAGGSVLIEQVFNVPGMGLLMMHAVQTQDMPLLTGFFLLTGALTVCCFFLIDISYLILDPRIRTSMRSPSAANYA